MILITFNKTVHENIELLLGSFYKFLLEWVNLFTY